MNEFSAHAGRKELIEFGSRFKDCAEQVLLVHGEPDGMKSLQSALHHAGVKKVIIPREGQTLEV